MLYVVLVLVIVLAAYVPHLWVRLVMHRHGRQIEDMPGTGGELARHLVSRFGLDGITVEATENGRDHFDPSARAVRLGQSNYEGKSLTAVAVAAHEVGHAIQFHRGEAIFRLRSRFLPTALALRRVGELCLLAVPVIALVFKAPPLILGFFLLSLALQLVGAGMYLIVLPEELDASFNKALPILEQGSYVPEDSLPAVRSVLRAAALTYFAAALADIVNIARWALLLRR